MTIKFRRNISWWLTAVAIIAVSTSPAITQGPEFKNFGLMALMTLSPLLLLLKPCRILIPRLDIVAGLYALLAIAMPLIFHPDTLRFSTLLLTAASSLWYMATARTARASGMSGDDFRLILRIIVYLYFGVLLVQQLCVVAGWPVFNAGMAYANPYKLNALMSEPSYSSFILSVIMFYHALSTAHSVPRSGILGSIRRYPLLWFGYCWVMFTTDNASSMIFWPLAILPLLTRKNILPVVGTVASVTFILAVTTPFIESTHTKRIVRVTKAIVKANPDSIIAADESIAFRVVPSIYGASRASVTTPDDWIGHGVDADKRDFPPRPTVEEGFAGMFHTWHNYGIPASMLLWALIIMAVALRRKPSTWILAALLIFICGECNWQFFWCPMTIAIIYRMLFLGGFAKADNTDKKRPSLA